MQPQNRLRFPPKQLSSKHLLVGEVLVADGVEAPKPGSSGIGISADPVEREVGDSAYRASDPGRVLVNQDLEPGRIRVSRGLRRQRLSPGAERGHQHGRDEPKRSCAHCAAVGLE